MYYCDTEKREFKSILDAAGDPEEKKRAEEFVAKITVVPDDISETSISLQIGGHMKKRSLITF